MEIKRTVKKYLKLYGLFLKYAAISSMAYRVSFMLELFVNIGYQVVILVFFNVIYGNIDSIAGWSYNEILLFTGINMFAWEIILNFVTIFNLRVLPTRIKNGVVDFTLLKPINSMFSLSLAHPLIVGFFSSLSGLFLIIYALIQLDIVLTFDKIFFSLIIFVSSLIAIYGFLVTLSSLSFYFENTKTLPALGERFVYEFKQFPRQVYSGLIRFIVMFIIPAGFIASGTAEMIIREIDLSLVFFSVLMAVINLLVAIKMWNFMIKFYTSASS